MVDETGEPVDSEQAPRRSQGPAKGTEASNRRQDAKPRPSGETIGTDQAAKLMSMAEDLEFGRKWVMETIKAQWELTDPRNLSPEQMNTVIALMNEGEQGQRAHDEAQAHEKEVADIFREADEQRTQDEAANQEPVDGVADGDTDSMGQESE